MNMQKFFVVAVAAVAIVGGWAYLWGNGNKEESPQLPSSGIIYYYGEECPHCKDVAKFLSESGIDAKISYEKKEVWHNRANSEEMTEKAKQCGLADDAVGVPFVFLDGKCYIGTPEVERIFREKADM